MTQDDINAIIKALNENEQLESLRMSYYYQKMQRERYQRKAQKLKEKQKKRQLMRESDFNKLPKELLSRYDVTFKPFTRNYFERRTTWFYLKGIKYIGDQYAHYEYPQHLLKRLTGVYWYNSNQREYLYKYNEAGELVVRAGLRQPESRFGLATFREKRKTV